MLTFSFLCFIFLYFSLFHFQGNKIRAVGVDSKKTPCPTLQKQSPLHFHTNLIIIKNWEQAKH